MKKLSFVLLAALGLVACGDSYSHKTLKEIANLPMSEQEKARDYFKEKLKPKEVLGVIFAIGNCSQAMIDMRAKQGVKESEECNMTVNDYLKQ